jgi:hypothetical protein
MREQSLRWWKNMSIEQQDQIIKEWKQVTNDTLRSDWTLPMVCYSSSAVERIYSELVMKENFN